MATKTVSDKFAVWCRSPWGLVILIVLAVAFIGHLALGALFIAISTGVMLFGHLILAIIGWRAEAKSPPSSAP